MSSARLTQDDARALLRGVLQSQGGSDPATQRERFLAVRALSDIPRAQLRTPALNRLIAEFDKPPVNPRPLNPAEVEAALDAIRQRRGQ